MARLGPVRVGGRNPVRIMGILNASPESFYKESVHTTKAGAAEAARLMEAEGADIIDVGGMSTAPYLSTAVPECEEIDRITVLIKAVQDATNLPISVDTCRSGAARTAMDLGVEILNDITGLKGDPEMADVVRRYNPSLVICAHSKNAVAGGPQETGDLLQESVLIAVSCGVGRDRMILDPAVGFFRRSGKGGFFSRIGRDHALRDLEVLHNLEEIKRGFPVLVSVSRKSFIGTITGQKRPEDRLSGSLACEVLSVLNGADVVRTHDVRESREAAATARRLARGWRRRA